jgi:GNAT superfamily N-acetyltransferase
MTDVRPAESGDIGPVGGALARAFHDDPVMVWLFGEREAPRLRRLRRFMTSEAARHHRRGSVVLTAAGHAGAALWDPPGRWRTTWPELVRSAPMMLGATGPRTRRALRGLGVIERAHPREPHWYLAMLGTDPPHQGKGVGVALVESVSSRCDAEGVGAYLESSKASNVPFYERLGFRVTGRIDLPDGPPMWPMWRDPR